MRLLEEPTMFRASYTHFGAGVFVGCLVIQIPITMNGLSFSDEDTERLRGLSFLRGTATDGATIAPMIMVFWAYLELDIVFFAPDTDGPFVAGIFY